MIKVPDRRNPDCGQYKPNGSGLLVRFYIHHPVSLFLQIHVTLVVIDMKFSQFLVETLCPKGSRFYCTFLKVHEPRCSLCFSVQDSRPRIKVPRLISGTLTEESGKGPFRRLQGLS